MKQSLFRTAVMVIALGAAVGFHGCAHIADGVSVVADTASKIAPGSKEIQQASKIAKTGADLAFNEIGPFQRFQMGYEVSARLAGEYKMLPQNHPLSQYIKMVGAAAAQSSKAPYQYRPYTFVLLDAKEINAFAAPGGFIFITAGMMRFLQNEDELAAILGHEIAHVELDHGVKAVGREKIIRLFNLIADIAVDTAVKDQQSKQLIAALMNEIMGLMMNKVRQGYSIEVEGEADRRAVEICYDTGYDPAALPRLLDRFQKVTGSYGGANYPKERSADIEKHLKTIAESVQTAPNPTRTQRYVAAMRSLGN